MKVLDVLTEQYADEQDPLLESETIEAINGIDAGEFTSPVPAEQLLRELGLMQ